MKKKSFLATITFAIMFIMVGCTTVDIGTQSTVTKDGLITTKLVLSYGGTLASQAKPSLISKVTNKDIEVQKYFKDDKYFEEVTGEAINLKEYVDTPYSFNDLLLYSYNKEKGFLKDTYNITMKFNPSVLTNESIVDGLQYINYANEITLPGKIVSTNAIEQNENTAKWSMKMDQVSETTSMIVAYSMINYTKIVLSAVVVGIIIGVVVYMFMRKRKVQ